MDDPDRDDTNNIILQVHEYCAVLNKKPIEEVIGGAHGFQIKVSNHF